MPDFTGNPSFSSPDYVPPDSSNSRIEADTIRILVATDNHVGYEERDPIRKDDSWKTFDEILNLAKSQDVRRCLAPKWCFAG